jgi:hypothetical protein
MARRRNPHYSDTAFDQMPGNTVLIQGSFKLFHGQKKRLGVIEPIKGVKLTVQKVRAIDKKIQRASDKVGASRFLEEVLVGGSVARLIYGS